MPCPKLIENPYLVNIQRAARIFDILVTNNEASSYRNKNTKRAEKLRGGKG